MKKLQIAIVVTLLAAIGIYFSCAGAPGGNAIGDSVIVHEASSVPTVDISGIDIVSPPSGSVSKAMNVGDPSSTGCLTKKFYGPMLQDSLKVAEFSNCVIKKTQEANHSFVIPFVEGDDADFYAYYSIALGDSFASITGVKNLRPRIANVSDGTTNTLKIDTCQSADGSSFKRTNHFEVTGKTSTHTWSGSTIAHNIGAAPPAFGGASFSIVMSSAGDLESTFDWSKATGAEFDVNQGQDPSTEDVTDATTFSNLLSTSFLHTALDPTLGVTKQSNESVFDGADFPLSSIFSMYTANDGAAKLLYNNGLGDYEDAQAYNPKDDFPKIIDSATVSYFSDVSDTTLPSTDLGDSVKQAVTFAQSWDCETPGGHPFTEIDASGLDMSACESLVSTLAKPDANTILACFGGVSLAGDYRKTVFGPECPVSRIVTLTGSGPVYKFESGADQIIFTYQNNDCESSSLNGLACDKCEFFPATNEITFQNCTSAVAICSMYTIQKM